MSDNNRSVNSEQLRNLRLRQPHAVILHANVQTGLAIGRLVNDNLSSVHRNKDTNKPEISKIGRSYLLGLPDKYNSPSLAQK